MQYDVIIIQSEEAQQELLIAVLPDLGAESFWQEETQLTVSFSESHTLTEEEKKAVEEAIISYCPDSAFE
jgi:hypothetical protein